MRAVKCSSDNPGRPRRFCGARRRICNRAFVVLRLKIAEKTLTRWIKERKVVPIRPGTDEQWFDMDRLIDAMEDMTSHLLDEEGKAK